MWQTGHRVAISTRVGSLEPDKEAFSYWDSMREELIGSRKMFSDYEDPLPRIATWPGTQEEALTLLRRVA